LQIAARRLDQATIFDITGHIDLANSPELRKTLLKELRENKTPRVILNLTGVRYIDSSGVASLVEGLKAAKDQGLRFILFGLSPAAREVLSVARLVAGTDAARMLQPGDILLAIDDKPVTQFRDVELAVANKPEVSATVWPCACAGGTALVVSMCERTT